MALSLGNETETALAEHLRLHAAGYFSQSVETAAQVTLLKTELRAGSCLHRFEVRLANQVYPVLIKSPQSSRESPARRAHVAADRPRIAVGAGPRRLALEHAALSYIHEHFSRLGDPRFGAIRVLDLVAESQALVMEAVDQHSLRKLAVRSGKLRSLRPVGARREKVASGTRRDLGKAFENAGAWLSAYHRLPAPESAETLQARRSDFVRYTEELATYLAGRLGHDSLLERSVSWTAAQAAAYLPDTLPLALTHGDYAMRNILVDVDQRVTVIDPLNCYRASIYRDIGCFIANLYCGTIPALGRGVILYAARVGNYRAAFLKGYFQDAAIPEQAIRLYEVQALLERWSSVVRRCSLPSTTTRAVLERGALPLLSAFFRAMIRARLATAKVSLRP